MSSTWDEPLSSETPRAVADPTMGLISDNTRWSRLLSAGFFASVKYRVNSEKLDRIRFFNKKRKSEGFESFTAAERREDEDLREELC